jgi:hypothetical protein
MLCHAGIRGNGLQLHAFLTSAVDGGVYSVSHLHQFTLGEKARKPLNSTLQPNAMQKSPWQTDHEILSLPYSYEPATGSCRPSRAWRIQSTSPHPTALWFVVMQSEESPCASARRMLNCAEVSPRQTHFKWNMWPLTRSPNPLHICILGQVLCTLIHWDFIFPTRVVVFVARLALPFDSKVGLTAISSLQIHKLQFRVHLSQACYK